MMRKSTMVGIWVLCLAMTALIFWAIYKADEWRMSGCENPKLVDTSIEVSGSDGNVTTVTRYYYECSDGSVAWSYRGPEWFR